MNGYLKQSTASQVRTIGPFVDSGDFVTLENGLTIANTDVILKKNGAASGAKNSGGATADGSGGLYHLTWDATDTATVGELSYSIKVAGALVVFGSYVVLEEALYDALFASSATGALPVSSGGIAAAAFAAGAIDAAAIANGAIDAATFAADVDAEILGYLVDDATRIDASALNTLSGHDPGETIMGATDLGTGSGLTSLATAAELAKVPKSDSNVTWNATAAAQLQSEAADALNAYDPPTKAELDSAVAPLATAANLSTVAGYLDTEIADILADTNELQTDWANGGRLDLILDARASQASVDDLPTNAELTTALGTADDAVLAAIAALNNLSSAGAQAAAAAALTAYSAATSTNVSSAQTAILAKLPSALSSSGNIKADVKEINDVAVQGAGVSGDTWRPV